MPNCCDEYGNCNQGRDCPVRVASYRPTMKAKDPLPPTIWRRQLQSLAYWALLALLAWLIWGPLIYVAFVIK